MWKSSLLLLAATAHLTAQSPATPEQIRALGFAIAPDGGGLPEGSGTATAGREVFAAHCASCHGEKAEGGVGPLLVGGQGTLASAKPVKTVGSFWPYAPTLFDYVRRAMPMNAPESLGDDDLHGHGVGRFQLHGQSG